MALDAAEPSLARTEVDEEVVATMVASEAAGTGAAMAAAETAARTEAALEVASEAAETGARASLAPPQTSGCRSGRQARTIARRPTPQCTSDRR